MSIRVDEIEQKEAPLLKIDENLAVIIMAAVKDTFKTLFQVNLDNGKPSQTEGYKIVGDYSGTVGMLQKTLEARLSITFNSESLRVILAGVYSESQLASEDILKDSVGEIINTIYGITKRELNKNGYNFKMTIPTITSGHNHILHHLHQGVNISIPFYFGKDHEFVVNVTVQRNLQDKD